MSKDDEALVIGRMVIERNELNQRRTLLDETIRQYAVRLQGIGLRLQHQSLDESQLLGDEELQAIESGRKINALLSERAEVRRRQAELDAQLRVLSV